VVPVQVVKVFLGGLFLLMQVVAVELQNQDMPEMLQVSKVMVVMAYNLT
jgi:hypothetical protein